MLGFLWRRDFLIPHDGIRKLIDDHIPYRNLEDARLPVHIVTTDIISGESVVLSEGLDRRGDRGLDRDPRRVLAGPLQGLLSRRRRDLFSNTPVRVAVAKGAKRLIVLPTGHACATNDAAGRARLPMRCMR